jgi:hypothetical protein
VLSALAFRVSGLQGLRAALGQRSGAANSAGLTTTLGRQIDALVTSDVVWRSLFLQPAVAALQQLHLAASLAPQSTFVANANLSSPSGLNTIAMRPCSPNGPDSRLRVATSKSSTPPLLPLPGLVS